MPSLRSALARPVTNTPPLRYNPHMSAQGHLTYFANNAALSLADRRFHFYAIGKTGMGKSTMLANMIRQDLTAGNGLALIDPHGDLAEQVLAYLPPDRQNELVYLNPADYERPVGFNVLENTANENRDVVAENMVAIFKHIWADSWGPFLEHLLRNSLMALLESRGTTFLGLLRLMHDPDYRQYIIKQIEDPVTRMNWQEEFLKYRDRDFNEKRASSLNKIAAFLNSRALRNILAQKRSSFNIQKIMDNSGILIANLAKGQIGEGSANLLGSLLVSQIQQTAMARASLPEKERRDFYLYVDEFQNFTTQTFASTLAEARKYRLNLILANQYLEQLDANIRAAVLGNVGTLAIFRVDPEDAKLLGQKFGSEWPWTNLVNLQPHQVYYKLANQGLVQFPREVATKPLPNINAKHAEKYRQKLIKLSQQGYGRQRSEIEAKIAKFLTTRPRSEKEQKASYKKQPR